MLRVFGSRGEYVSKEKEQARLKREHPGWSYSQRRFGLDGCIDFNVSDSQVLTFSLAALAGF